MRFLSDKPLVKTKDNHFGHQTIANTIVEIVEKSVGK